MKNCDNFLYFAQNIDRGYTLESLQRGGSIEYPQSMFLREAVLTSTHNLCFRAKIRNNEYPGKPQFSNIEVGCKGRTCFHDTLFGARSTDYHP